MSSDPNRSAVPHAFQETHTVETPEQTNIEFTVAGVGSRALAFLVDSLIEGGVIMIGLILLGVFTSFSVAALRVTGAWVLAAFLLAAFLLYYGYFALFEFFWNGQTPGKRIVGIRVIKDSGRRLSAFETIGRNLLRIVDQLPGFYAVGILTSLLNRQNKRLGDLVAGAIVVRERKRAELTPSWHADQTTAKARGPLGAERLTDDELILIESFLARRWQLDPTIRWRMADEILRRLEGKLSFRPDERAGAEHLLEAAVAERRGGM